MQITFEMYCDALKSGIKDKSYQTIGGFVPSFSGEATITAEGKQYRVVGYSSTQPGAHIIPGGLRFTQSCNCKE